MVERIQPAKESTAQEIKTAVESIGSVVLESGGAITSNGKTYEPIVSTTPIKFSEVANTPFESENYLFYHSSSYFYRAPKNDPFNYSRFGIPSISGYANLELDATADYATVLGYDELLHDGKFYFFYASGATSLRTRTLKVGWFDVENGTFGVFDKAISISDFLTVSADGTYQLKIFFKDDFLYICPFLTSNTVTYSRINCYKIEGSNLSLARSYDISSAAMLFTNTHIVFGDNFFFLISLVGNNTIYYRKFGYTSSDSLGSYTMTLSGASTKLSTVTIKGDQLYVLTNGAYSYLTSLNTSTLTGLYGANMGGQASFLFFHKDEPYILRSPLSIYKVDKSNLSTMVVADYTTPSYLFNNNGNIIGASVLLSVTSHDLKNLKFFMILNNIQYVSDMPSLVIYRVDLFVEEIIGYREVVK